MRHAGLRLLTGLLVTHVLALSAPVTNSARNSLEVLSDDESILFANEKEFLDPDVAFQLMAEQVSENRIVTEWRIAEGYYLYREKFGFVLAAGEDGVLPAQLGEPHYPPGKLKTDQFFGEMEIYQSDTQIVLPLKAARAPSAKPPLTLRASYQGCAEAGICYPPTTKTVVLHGGVTAAKALPTEAKISEQDQIARRLASRDWLLVISIFLGAGLALAFTPCVLPMIPILSGIIVGEGERLNTRSAFTLSLTYVMAMALMYAVAGAVAGVSGHNLQAMFQNPAVLVAFSAVFVLLALSMFDFYELQLPSRWQSKLAAMSNKHGGGTYGGVAVMGALSAIIVGPCVAPPLAGALIYIGQTGDAVLGAPATPDEEAEVAGPAVVPGERHVVAMELRLNPVPVLQSAVGAVVVGVDLRARHVAKAHAEDTDVPTDTEENRLLYRSGDLLGLTVRGLCSGGGPLQIGHQAQRANVGNYLSVGAPVPSLGNRYPIGRKEDRRLAGNVPDPERKRAGGGGYADSRGIGAGEEGVSLQS